MKTALISTALIELQRRTGLVIDPRQATDVAAVLGELHDAAHAAGAQSVPAPAEDSGKLTADEVSALRALARSSAKTAKKK